MQCIDQSVLISILAILILAQSGISKIDAGFVIVSARNVSIAINLCSQNDPKFS